MVGPRWEKEAQVGQEIKLGVQLPGGRGQEALRMKDGISLGHKTISRPSAPPVFINLNQWPWSCCSGTSSIGTTWELIRNADSWASPQP